MLQLHCSASLALALALAIRGFDVSDHVPWQMDDLEPVPLEWRENIKFTIVVTNMTRHGSDFTRRAAYLQHNFFIRHSILKQIAGDCGFYARTLITLSVCIYVAYCISRPSAF